MYTDEDRTVQAVLSNFTHAPEIQQEYSNEIKAGLLLHVVTFHQPDRPATDVHSLLNHRRQTLSRFQLHCCF